MQVKHRFRAINRRKTLTSEEICLPPRLSISYFLVQDQYFEIAMSYLPEDGKVTFALCNNLFQPQRKQQKSVKHGINARDIK